ELCRQPGIRSRQIAAELCRRVSREVENSTRVPAEAAPAPSNEASPIASRDIRKVSLTGHTERVQATAPKPFVSKTAQISNGRNPPTTDNLPRTPERPLPGSGPDI